MESLARPTPASRQHLGHQLSAALVQPLDALVGKPGHLDPKLGLDLLNVGGAPVTEEPGLARKGRLTRSLVNEVAASGVVTA